MVMGTMTPKGSKIPEDHRSISRLVVVGQEPVAIQGERKSDHSLCPNIPQAGLLESGTCC